jgi:uncharacterized YigZ family protein
MKDQYRTIASTGQGEFRDRGSRFLGFAFPVEDEKEIRAKILELKKKYHDARHHCYAWRLGSAMERYRVNDDGEPSGSAGQPIFGQIQAGELTQVLVVVVRYFGGTLLGVGGLIRAYRAAAAAALEQAGSVEKKVEQSLELNFPYPQTNAVMQVLKEYRLKPDSQHFDLDCSLTVRIWTRHLDAVKEKLSRIEGCRVSTART